MTITMTLEQAQQDVRRAYVHGGPGIIVSAIVWFVAAWMLTDSDVRAGFIALFIGGMAIFPLSALLCRFAFGRPDLVAENGLKMLALESTIAMGALLFAAWLILPHQPELVFPISAIAVGTHYFAFKTLYGDRTYWVLAAILTGIGFAGIFTGALTSVGVALAVGVVEAAFGVALIIRDRATG